MKAQDLISNYVENPHFVGTSTRYRAAAGALWLKTESRITYCKTYIPLLINRGAYDVRLDWRHRHFTHDFWQSVERNQADLYRGLPRPRVKISNLPSSSWSPPHPNARVLNTLLSGQHEWLRWKDLFVDLFSDGVYSEDKAQEKADAAACYLSFIDTSQRIAFNELRSHVLSVSGTLSADPDSDWGDFAKLASRASSTDTLCHCPFPRRDMSGALMNSREVSSRCNWTELDEFIKHNPLWARVTQAEPKRYYGEKPDGSFQVDIAGTPTSEEPALSVELRLLDKGFSRLETWKHYYPLIQQAMAEIRMPLPFPRGEDPALWDKASFAQQIYLQLLRY